MAAFRQSEFEEEEWKNAGNITQTTPLVFKIMFIIGGRSAFQAIHFVVVKSEQFVKRKTKTKYKTKQWFPKTIRLIGLTVSAIAYCRCFCYNISGLLADG